MNQPRALGGALAAGAAFILLVLLSPLVVLLSATTAAASCVTPAVGVTAGGMNATIVAGAYAEAVARSASPRVLLALFEAGLDESSFRNLANDNVPSSLSIPHDGVGNDHTSVGYLQQQVGVDGTGALFGWGTVAQAMTTQHATDAFLNTAIPLDATVVGDAATLTQAVQRSATSDGSNYRAFQAQAAAMLAAEAGGPATPSGSAAPGPSVTAPSAAVSPTTAAPLPTVSRPVGKLSPSTGAYVGAYTSTTGLTDTASVETYFKKREGLAGRSFAIQNFMPGWNQPIAGPLVRWDLAQGIIPLISWNTPDGMSAATVAGGGQDAWIRTQADAVKALGQDVFLRLDWEMNGNWFPWAGDPASYVTMWRHIHDSFTAEGATNVAWVWTPSAQSLPDTPGNAMTAYYPGDTYVDWVGEDDYNYGGTLGHSGGWNDFTSQLQPLYGTFATRKPIMIGEMGSADGIPGHDKGQWITTMAAQVKADYPDVQALVWFDVKYDADWRFDTSPGSSQAFRAWLADPYYNPSSRAENVGAPGSACVGDGGDGSPTGPPGNTGPPATTTLPNGFTITGSPAGTKAVQYALAQLGKPYVWGAAGPNAFDCSGLTMAAWATAGVSLPHFTGDQVHAGAPEPLDLSSAQAGDLVFIPGSDGTPTDPRHVGMVAGTTTDAAGTHLWLVEAPHTGANVELIDVTRWAGRISAVRHIG